MSHSHDMAVWNVHRMSIKIEHKNLEIRKTRNDFSVQVRNLLLPLSLKVLWHKDQIHNLSILAFSSPPPSPQHVWHPPQRSPRASESQPSSPKAGSTLLLRCLVSTPWLFQNLPKSSARFRCVTSLALCNPVSHLGLLWHLWVTRSLGARAWTPVLMLHLTNPCAEPKGSQPN